MGFFNWNSNDTTATNSAKTEVPTTLLLGAQSCNALEIPKAQAAPNNDHVVAKDGSLSFSNIFHDLAGQPQFNMMAAVEAKPAEQPTCISQTNETETTSQPTDALHNITQSGGNGEMPTLMNQPSGNGEMPTLMNQPSGNREVPTLMNQPSGNREMPTLMNQPSGNGDITPLTNQPGGTGDIPLIVHQPDDDSLPPLSHQDGENDRLDCAKVVSEKLNQIDQRIQETSNLTAMRNELTKNGWDQIAQDPSQFDPQQLQPGDVITGTRLPGMPGHAAIYLGGSMIYNNSSDAGMPEVDSVDKFMQKQFNADGSFNRNGYSNIYVYRNQSQSFRQNEINGLADLSE